MRGEKRSKRKWTKQERRNEYLFLVVEKNSKIIQHYPNRYEWFQKFNINSAFIQFKTSSVVHTTIEFCTLNKLYVSSACSVLFLHFFVWVYIFSIFYFNIVQYRVTNMFANHRLTAVQKLLKCCAHKERLFFYFPIHSFFVFFFWFEEGDRRRKRE